MGRGKGDKSSKPFWDTVLVRDRAAIKISWKSGTIL